MAIFKRGKSKIWHYEFLFHGQRVQRSTGQRNKQIAKEMENEHLSRLAKGEIGLKTLKPAPLFPDAMKQFLAWSENEHRAHVNTFRRYQTSSAALLTHFKNARLDTITAGEVEKFKQQRSKAIGQRTGRVLRPASVNRELACLRALFNHAKKDAPNLVNPVRKDGVRLLAEDNEQTRVLTYEEERLYLQACSQPLKDIAVLMLETGARPEEVYRIERSNVHLADGYLFNPFGKTKAAKRRIPLNARAHEVLARRLAEAKGTCLFPHVKDVNKPLLKVNRAHDGALARSGIQPARLYDLRHTWASRMAQSGCDLVTLASLLGHSKINMVLRYAHISAEHQRSAVAKAEQYKAAQQLAAFENQGHRIALQ